MLQSENLSGLYTIPSFASSLEWFGVLFVRDEGIYKDGVFRFRILIPPTFPDDAAAIPVSEQYLFPTANLLTVYLF